MLLLAYLCGADVEECNTHTCAGEDGDEEVGLDDYLCAKMHLVDLAGSERLQRTQAEADRRTEGLP